ncbi:hypothetical protein C2857_002625 [Epichloe festucae Fl1]|uniref:Cryptochrome DASH n=1 Tax=Epichloe festucae (strain Fl1) TaxID=877507 RepID=A0A7U3SND0_EPIFF|nr:hypothetical protein C2857_002625 [Epichloe festucae Fl1]
MSRTKLLVYLLRRDLRVADNPILHHLASVSDHGFTHLLPVYVFPAHQIEISGFLKDEETCPYPPATSQVGKFWRCGPHRAKFLAESVWNLKRNLEELGSGLVIRVGSAKDVLGHLVKELKDTAASVNSVWMTEELSWEEEQEQKAIASLCSEQDIDFKIWKDEKYFVDDRDTGLAGPEDLPDVFTTYRKSQEPLREKPRKVLSRPGQSSLPALPAGSMIPDQAHPFVSASSLEDLCKKLTTPLVNILPDPPAAPEVTQDSNPPPGGESAAWERLTHLAKSGALTSYKNTRNGLVGTDYSTKLSSYLAIGCLTARQIHEELLKLEDGASDDYKDALGFGGGENDGTKGIRFELLWRDYMRLCTAKFGRNLFRLSGFRQEKSYNKKWNTPSKKGAIPNQGPCPAATAKIFERFKNGTTGMGLIDASQRELYLTGYTSNRARQNVASFLSKHLGIDWRYGAEWYEMLLVDYDVSSNWANWQYVSGVGNDPRGDARTFNPVKQAFDYDKEGTFVRTWIPELQGLEKLENLFQVWTTEADDLERCGLSHNNMATDPVKKIDFHVDRKPRSVRRTLNRRRGQQRGGRWGNSHSHQSHNNESGTSSDATASDTAAGASGNGNGEARNQVGSQGTVAHSPTSVSTWRGNYSGGGAPPHTHGYGNRGWHNGDQTRGGRGYGQNRGYWRPSGPRGGFMGRYQGGPAPPQMVFHPQYPGPAQ